MDVWTLMRTALRRWYVFIPVVGASLGLGYTMASDLDPVYTAESSAILTAPEIIPGQGLQAGELVEVNPYLNLGGGLQTTTQVMVVLMDSEPQRLDYLERGLEPDYEVSRTDAVIFFTVTGTDEEAVITTANELVEIADDEIALLQKRENRPPEQRIRVRPLSLPDTATEDGGAGTQLMAILGVLGLVAGLAAAVALDGFLRWRRTRRADRAERTAAAVHESHGGHVEPAAPPTVTQAEPARRATKGAKPAAPTAKDTSDTPTTEPDWGPAAEDNPEVRADNPTSGHGDHADLPNLPRRTPGATQPEPVSAPTRSTTA